MNRRKVDNRIYTLIQNCVSSHHRSLFVVVGEKGRDQIDVLHGMLTKASVISQPTVLWCYKKEPGFITYRKKTMKRMKRNVKQGIQGEPFEVFIASANIRYCCYSKTQQILGQTFEMLVLQDFEAVTPNFMARTTETVVGGGMIVILMHSITSLRQLYTMPMDIHAQYPTEAYQNVVYRFNERFVLSLPSCPNCLIVNDKLDILPHSSNAANIKPVPPKHLDDPKSPADQELSELKEAFHDTQPVGILISLCKTLDQAKAILKFIDALSEKTLHTTVALTSARGRGKSTALGLAIAGAIAFNYSNIFVTSPSPESLKTLFSFVLKGFDVLGYEDHLDYEVIQSVNPEFNKAVVRVNVFRNYRQTIQYIHPTDADKLGQAELVIIDEAAAIPLPYVKSLLGPYLVFVASTISGYEGTGSSLSLKLINLLRQQTASVGNDKRNNSSTQLTLPSTGRSLHEITLSEPICYHSGDGVEAWLNYLLCLDATFVPRLLSGCPEPRQCQLYYINRDALFSYHKPYEAFLQRTVALFVASHYKNSPDDLHMMSDAPNHHLFCLLPPFDSNIKTLPQVLCVIQICLEGRLSKDSVLRGMSCGKQAAGALIPWTMFKQFGDDTFLSLSGARIVRIATHPDYQRMGYGLRALQLLQEYYEGKILTLDEIPDHVSNNSSEEEEYHSHLEEKLQPRKSLPPLLLQLTERRPEVLDYVGVSYGLTAELLRFWKKSGFVPVYLSDTQNDLTGEYSCIMLKALENEFASSSWLPKFVVNFREQYVALLSNQFRNFLPALALSVLTSTNVLKIDVEVLTREELDLYITTHSIKRLEVYCQNLMNYSVIMDLVPTVAELYFLNHLGDVSLTFAQMAILLCLGLQQKSVDQTAAELELKSSQIVALFNRTMCRLTQRLRKIIEDAVVKTLSAPREVHMEPMEQTLEEELAEAAREFQIKQKDEAKKFQDMDFSEYAIKGSEDEWQKVAVGDQKTLVSVKRIQKSSDDQLSYKRSKKQHGKKSSFKKRKM